VESRDRSGRGHGLDTRSRPRFLAVEPGLYLTFFTEGEAFDKELPPVGPLEHVVVRDRLLVADRKDGQHAGAFDGGSRHIDAEYEFQRATGNEPGGARRSSLRVVAPEGVYLRFVSFGSEAEHDPIPELGPYAVVVITKSDVEADGDRIANRTGSGHKLWELTHVGGSALTGTLRPDIAFRTRSTAYHPQIKPFRPARHTIPVAAPAAAAPVRPATPTVRPAAPPPRAEPEIPRPVAPSPPPRAAAVVAPPPRPIDPVVPTLRARLGQEPVPARSGAVAAGRGRAREWGGALWQLRFVVLAALVLLVAAFSVPSVRSLFAGGTPAGSTVGIGTPLTSPNWTYSVGSVRRIAKIGNAQARGIYLGAGCHHQPRPRGSAARAEHVLRGRCRRAGLFGGVRRERRLLGRGESELVVQVAVGVSRRAERCRGTDLRCPTIDQRRTARDPGCAHDADTPRIEVVARGRTRSAAPSPPPMV